MYVDKKSFDEVFNLKELINNELLNMVLSYDDYYYITYDEKLYDRLYKISKLSYTDEIKKAVYSDTIDKYIKIIKYCKKNELSLETVYASEGAKQLAKEIDKHIIEQLFKIKNDDTIK